MSDSQSPVPISGFVGQRAFLALASRTSSHLYGEESLTKLSLDLSFESVQPCEHFLSEFTFLAFTM